MKKLLLSAALIVSFGLYAIFDQPTSADTAGGAQTPTTATLGSKNESSGTTQPPHQTSQAGSAPATQPAQTQTSSSGQYADGTYTGSVANAYYGSVQVQATVSGGALTDVIFLQYPNDRRTSQQINAIATRYLTQEAISAQSANVATVSGASDTSAAFRESLASALSQAAL